ncbi:MAG TPA: PEP/pyruvate-binding domain-containing protein, partial [Candidatus Anoxymicrobiaceae bacterium]
MPEDMRYVVWLENIGKDDIAIVGGKNANSGEMISTLKKQGIRVPEGFATTADAYRAFLEANDLESKIKALLLRCSKTQGLLEETGREIRRLILASEFPEEISAAI